MILDLRMAWRALRRARGLTVVMVIALALGIGTWYAQQRVFAFLATKTPYVPAHLFHVALERGTLPTGRIEDVVPYVPSLLLAPRDARGVAAAATTRKVITFGAPAVLEPAGAEPEIVRARYATRDLFDVFAVPLVAGTPWSTDTADEVVIDEALARRLFDGGSALGQRLRVDGADLRIVGVVARQYELRFHLYERFVVAKEMVYVPIGHAEAAQAAAELQHDIAGDAAGSVSVWVELPTEAARSVFVAAAEAYLARERTQGRPAVPSAMTLRPASVIVKMFAPGGTLNLWPMLSALCMLTCIVNLVRMLMVKFAGRRHELGLLRAFGARRRAVMAQLLVEGTLVGLVAGLLGIVLGLALMPLALGTVRGVTGVGSPEWISLGAVVTTLGASAGVALLAAIYPAWRLARGTPVTQLRGP